MLGRAVLLCWAALGGAAAAQQVVPADYDGLRQELDGIITFESLPRRPEPGMSFNENLRFPGAFIGERFAGQQIATGAAGHDRLAGGRPEAPLRAVPGPPGRNQSVAFHRGFGSNALFPLGPDGFEEITGRGEGAVSILFDSDQSALGLRLQTHYPAPLGNAPALGRIEIAFFARDGSTIAVLGHDLAPGVAAFGWRRDGDRADIAGVLITNTDPGGIAVDDIIFQRTPPLG